MNQPTDNAYEAKPTENAPRGKSSKGCFFYGCLFTFLFRLIEELIPLFSKYGSLGRAGSHLFEEIVWPQFWAIQIWLYMSLVLYCSAVELIRILGKDRVKEIFFGRKK